MDRVVLNSEPTGPNAPVERPAHVPEKFWKDGAVDVEGLSKSYTELEQKQSKPEAKPEVKPEVKPAAIEIQPALDKAGLNTKDLSTEFVVNGGKLTDATVAKLEAAGITKAQIDTYIAGAKAAADKIVSTVTEAAGGADKLKAVYDWAAVNLKQDEIAAYNSVLDAGNPLASKLAFEGLLSRHNTANPADPKLIQGENAPLTTGIKPFASTHEITDAMRDPRYKRGDGAYIAEVEKRMAATYGLAQK